eukprot:1754915-Prymnesium_polylepis.1
MSYSPTPSTELARSTGPMSRPDRAGAGTKHRETTAGFAAFVCAQTIFLENKCKKAKRNCYTKRTLNDSQDDAVCLAAQRKPAAARNESRRSRASQKRGEFAVR